MSKVFLRGPDGWITCRWRFLDRAPMPFGELAWDHACRNLAEPGRPATEADIADAVAALLTRAYSGPAPGSGPVSRKDQRVAARTRAVTPPPSSPQPEEPETADAGTGDERLADVIPMPLFNPFDDDGTRW